MDYYGFRNIQADTEMRRSISGTPPGTQADSHQV
jgi:uncharacterized protein YqfA (UPF0365 family)